MSQPMEMDKIWVEKNAYADAEKQYYENLAKLPSCKGFLSFGISVDGSCPFQPEEHSSPKSFVAIKKISISECDTNKENVCASNPETPKSNIKKIKSQKCILSKDESSEWITVCSKAELKEKNSKKNKKSKDRTAAETVQSPVVNKDVSSPTLPKDEVTVPVVQLQATQPQVTQPAQVAPPTENNAKSPKNKDSKEKANKAEKKRNKKDKSEAKEEKPAQIVEKVEEVVQEVEKMVEKQGESATQNVGSGQCSLSREIAKARQHIKNSLECMDSVMASVPSVEIVNRINTLESTMNELRNLVLRVQEDVNSLKKSIPAGGQPAAKPAQVKAPAPSKEESDDGVDLFASDSEDDEAAAKIREERLAAYSAKKSKKPALIAKSSVILDVKPWDDETNMEEMEKLVRKIEMDGLLWGASKFVLLAYGIKKLQINCVVEDEKVSIDLLQEEIEKLEDLVQSVDIAAFNKI